MARPALPRPILATLLAVSALSMGLACARNASVSRSQCAAGDWETIGYRDGAQGWRSSRLLAHQDACVPHGVVPDRVAYQRGWHQGIAEFCAPENGFELGQRGEDHGNVCPATLRVDFLSSYERGYRLFAARERVAGLERAISGRKLRLEQIDPEIATTIAAQVDPLLLPTERVALAARVKQLFDEKARIAAEIPPLEDELRVRVAELEQLDRALAAASL